MADPYVRTVGVVEDMDRNALAVIVDYDTVRFGPYQLTSAQAEEFAQAFVAACWQAGRNAQRMEHEAADA